MSFNVKWTVSGTKFDDAAKALTTSINNITNGESLKKYENHLNQNFKENIRKEMRLSGLDGMDFDEVFFLKINNGSINFVNTDPLITQRYEYGYYLGSKDTNEEYYEEYMIETSPRYFIRPAIEETMQEISQLMIQEANQEYMKNRHQSNGDDIY